MGGPHRLHIVRHKFCKIACLHIWQLRREIVELVQQRHVGCGIQAAKKARHDLSKHAMEMSMQSEGISLTSAKRD